MTGPSRQQHLNIHACVLYDPDIILNLQFFTKKTYPLLILQADKPHLDLTIDINDLSIERDSAATGKGGDTGSGGGGGGGGGGAVIIAAVDEVEYLTKAINLYMGLPPGVRDPDIQFRYRCHDIVVFRVHASTERTIDLSKDDILNMYIVTLLLKLKVIFVKNIPHNRYHQILENVSEQWSSKFLGQSPHSGMQ